MAHHNIPFFEAAELVPKEYMDNLNNLPYRVYPSSVRSVNSVGNSVSFPKLINSTVENFIAPIKQNFNFTKIIQKEFNSV